MLTKMFAVLAFGLAAMSGSALAADTPAIPDYVAASIANPARPDTDKARDEARKPAEMLMIAGVKPGSKVLEILPEGGYFTRLFAGAVGKTGRVYGLYGPTPAADADQRVKDMMASFVKSLTDINTAYGNVTPVGQSFSSFTLPESVDVVWTSQNYHDLHLPQFKVDVPAFNKAVFNALKPGGLFIVLDHSALDGAGLDAAGKLHRMDEAVAKQELAAAGFKLLSESNAMRNPADPRTAMVFDPSIRGKTDQFILVLQKPAQ